MHLDPSYPDRNWIRPSAPCNRLTSTPCCRTALLPEGCLHLTLLFQVRPEQSDRREKPRQDRAEDIQLGKVARRRKYRPQRQQKRAESAMSIFKVDVSGVHSASTHALPLAKRCDELAHHRSC